MREVVRAWRPELEEWHRAHIPAGAPALSVGTISMLAAVMRGTDLWSIVPAGIGDAIVESVPSHVFLPLAEYPPPGPDAHVLLPKKMLPWVTDAAGILMDAVREVVAHGDHLEAL